MKSSYLINLILWSIINIMLFLSKVTSQTLYPTDFPTASPQLLEAYIALQAWKQALTSDPNQFTANWHGPDVCNYTGVYCAPAPYDPFILTVAGIDLNHADIAGFLPEELGLLKDLALIHLNSNRFFGVIPDSFIHLEFLFELDISNNHFSGPFPSVVFNLHSLKYLDVRFNEFDGNIPSQLFELKLDAIFINNNRFQSALPANLGNSPASVFVAANNDIRGCIPPSLLSMAETVDEIILSNMALTGCLRQDIELRRSLTVLDVSFNNLTGPLPESIGALRNLEELNVAHNKFSGQVPSSICSLPKLRNFTYSFNYFSGEPLVCLRLPVNDDTTNCIPNRPFQRTPEECSNFYARPISCGSIQCPTS